MYSAIGSVLLFAIAAGNPARGQVSDRTAAVDSQASTDQPIADEAVVDSASENEIESSEASDDETEAETEAETAAESEAAPDRELASDEQDAEEGGTTSAFDAQIAWVKQLANAYRLRDELETVLRERDDALAGMDAVADNRLAGLATRSETLAQEADFELARAVLLACQARANAELVRRAARGSEQARQRRLDQVRRAAEALRVLDTPGAEVSADYWLLLADLASSTLTQVQGEAEQDPQALAEALLKGFIAAHGDAEAGREYLVDARLSLAQLLDERGDQRAVLQQLEAIGKLPEDSQRGAQAQRLRQSAARIGKPVQLEAATTRLGIWRLTDYAGQPVLLHIYADAVEPSLAMIAQIEQAIADDTLGGAAVVSLRVGEPIKGAAKAPWPTLVIGLEAGGVLDRLGVQALPTLVWIDGRGRVASVGHSAAVLQQMPGETKQQQTGAPEPEAAPGPGESDENRVEDSAEAGE